ncbi:MAG: hypothetical protein KKD29_05860 [Candidatus Omnitrophica bacterium]|nr:hypothetical protein [Candidatus Omnitrophota bacterium]MBU4488863.1 hypothetical protein [Candidatus Omnitrophota bacterium]MCG2705661.1 hypothetical protein [Candidatus Omnitrophota bacterium]
MSKIVDLLTYRKRNAEKKGYEDFFSPKIITENFDTKTKEHLANTYILNPLNTPSKNKKEETIIMPPRKASNPSYAFMRLFPWLISLLAVLLLLINIAYRGKINIKIEFLGGETAKAAPEAIKEVPAKKILPPPVEPVALSPLTSFFIVNGEINERAIKRLGFYGGALKDSRILKDGICLINDGTAAWASAGFDLISPADLTMSSLDFFVKGSIGRESLQVILRDADNNSYIPQAQNMIFNKNMNSEWQFVSIPLNNLKGHYNTKRIKHIGFEFGTQTTANEPGTCIYIKNMKIASK